MEDELLDQPQSNDDFFDDVSNETIEELSNEEQVEDNNEENKTEDEGESKPTDTESEVDSEDYQDVLDKFSKLLKYNGESVSIENIDDLKNTYQKGLNYDKQTQKLNDLENSRVFKYVESKAKEMGMTTEEYMDQVEEYERAQQRQKQQSELEEMIEKGIPEEAAKEILATRQLRKEVQEERSRLEQERVEREQDKAKDKEYADFIEEFPNVKPEDIPKEVFLDAQNSSLKEAYLKWENDKLNKQLEVLKTNSKNKESTIGSTTDTGTVNEKHESDPFLEGFNSV